MEHRRRVKGGSCRSKVKRSKKEGWLHCSWDTPGRKDQSEKSLMLPGPNSERFILGRLNARHDFQELVWRGLRGYFCGHEDRFIFPAVWPGANMFPIVFLSVKEKEGLYLQQAATARKFMLGVWVIHPFLQLLRWGDVVLVLKHWAQSLNERQTLAQYAVRTLQKH